MIWWNGQRTGKNWIKYSWVIFQNNKMTRNRKLIENIIYVLQIPYIAVLNFFFQLTKGVGEKVKNAIIGICCFALVIYPALNYSDFLSDIIDDYNYKMLLISVLVIFLALFGMKEKVKHVAWKPMFTVVYYLFAISILVARYHHSLANGYTMFALFLLIVLPAYTLVWNNRNDYRQLFDWLAFAMVVVGLGFYVGSLIVWPYAPYFFFDGRYTGLTTNPNLLGMIFACVLVGACYLLYRSKHMIISVISLGMAVSMLYLSESRTAMLASVLAIIAEIICYLRKREADRIPGKRAVFAIGLTVLITVGSVIALSAPVKYFSYYGIEQIKQNFDSGNKFTLEECDENGIKIGDTSKVNLEMSYRTADYKDVFEIDRVANADTPSALNRWQKNTDINAFGSGRVALYKWVIQHTTLWGVDREKNPVDVYGIKYTGTHNTVLDYAYQCGWFSGILCFLIKLSTIIFVIRFLFGKRMIQKGTLLAVMLVLIYAVESTLEIQTIPSTRDVTCYFYLMLPVLFMGIEKASQKRRI